MYNQVFGGQTFDIGSEFESNVYDFEEFDKEIVEVCNDRPYEFCDMIKKSGGD